MVDQRNPGNMSYECQMEKTLQKLHDVNQLRQKLLLERATLKSQLDKLLQRSVNDVDLIGGDEDDDYDNDGGDGDSGGGNGGGVGQTQSDNCQLHETEDFKSKDTVKQIRSKIKELEKRCALQLLKHEEILLEIEDVRKRSFNHSNINHNHNNNSSIITTINTIKNQLNDIDSINQLSSSTSCLINNQNQNQNNQNNKIYGRLLQSGQQQQQQQQQHQHKLKQDDIQSTYEMDSLLFDSSAMGIIELDKQMTTNTTNKQVKGRLFRSNTDLQITEGDDPNLVELFQVIEESRKSTDVPAPRMITLERQLFQSVLISWKSPELNENKIVSAYHIYVDGQFRLAVMAKEKTRALIDNVDADKPHRISIRSISSHGQSKDAQCTLVVGRGMTATPARLKATQIGTKSAKLSWIPGNSNYYHRVYLNETSLHVCKPGVYKLHLTDLPPDTLHQVCVQALPSPISIQESAQQSPPWINTACSGVYTQKLAAFIEFRTLPIGLPDPPSHVQIEAGPQDGMLLITWLPVPQDKNAVEAVTAAGASSTLPVQGYTVCLNGQAIMELKGASRDHAILKLSTIKDHIQKLLHNSIQSPTDMYDHNTSHLSNSNHSNKSTTKYHSMIELYITVHSTIPNELLSKQEINISKECKLIKGSEGPASKPIHLTASLLILAAGSLETAYKIFGLNLATKLGINENTAKLAGVSLSLDGLQETTTLENNQNVENINSDEDHGLLVVSAENVARKPSPTADALGSAEYYFGHRNPHENLSLPEIQITRNSSLSDNEPQFQANDQYQQQTRYSYQDFRGPTRPIRSRFMDTRRHGSYDPQMNTANFSTTRHDPDYSRPVVPSDSYTPGPKRPFHFNMPSPASGPIPQHEYRPSFNQVNIKSCRSGDQGSGLRQSVVSQYSRPSKSFIQIEQQYGRNQRNINDDYSSRISHNELKPIQVVVALYDYDPTTMSPNIDGAQEELPFREGQLIKILTECDEDGFYLGECNGLRGLVPSNMVSELQSHSLRSQKINHSIDSHSNLINNNYLSSDQLNIIRSTDMNSPIQNYYYTTRKYDPFISQSNTTPRNTDFINEQVYQQQQQQQQMTIPDYSDIKELHNNELEQEGYSQSQTKYTTEINPNTINQTSNKSMESVQQQQQQQQQQPQQQQQQQQPNQQSKIMIAIYDYDPHVLSPNADIDAELSFRAGELITVYGNMDDDGFYYGETKDGRRGLVPSNFLHSCTNDTNYLNKQKNSSTISTQLSSTNISINHRDQSYSMDPNNSSVRMQSRTNSSQFHNPNSDRTKLMHNNTRPNSPCTQTRLYTTNNSSEVINTNINSTAYHRDELTMNGMERFPENEENPIIVMDLNPISNHSHRKGNSTKDYDTPYIHQHDTDISDNYVASTGPSYNQRRRSTIRSLFKRE
ncbi:unnamed protein product [Schistosoma rodhaini]|uniref:SH3 domain-containing protein n=1 Tax=Schistosoma rodhaini TaxID=6188 RepID=A0AA85FXB4_9TREM|nr:unnamed protein product [Schistosoma rodhaini]